MKAIKHVLFVDQDDRSLNPIFRAIVQRAASADSVLSTAGLVVDTAGIEFPGTGAKEGMPPTEVVSSALNSLGLAYFQHNSKSVRMYPELVHWADLILVPRLMEEDLLCMTFHETWSKAIQIECFCGKYEPKKKLLSYSNEPKTEEDYSSIATHFKTLLPFLMDKIKDSYSNCLIVKGIGMNRGTTLGNATVIGNASVVGHGFELENFTKGNILVVDRLGAVLKRNVDKGTIISTMEKLAEKPEFCDDELQQIQDKLGEFDATLHGKKTAPKVD